MRFNFAAAMIASMLVTGSPSAAAPGAVPPGPREAIALADSLDLGWDFNGNRELHYVRCGDPVPRIIRSGPYTLLVEGVPSRRTRACLLRGQKRILWRGQISCAVEPALSSDGAMAFTSLTTTVDQPAHLEIRAADGSFLMDHEFPGEPAHLRNKRHVWKERQAFSPDGRWFLATRIADAPDADGLVHLIHVFDLDRRKSWKVSLGYRAIAGLEFLDHAQVRIETKPGDRLTHMMIDGVPRDDTTWYELNLNTHELSP